MKLLLAFLLLVIPLTSTAAAYRWVDENGNVRFGSKPQAEQPAPAAKAQPKPPSKKTGNTSGIKILPRKEQPAITPAPAPSVLRAEKPPTPAPNPQPIKPIPQAVSADSGTAAEAAPPKQAVRKLPALPPAPAAKTKANKPAPTSPRKASAPPASQPAKAAKKPTPKKKKQKVVKAKAVVKADKKVSQPPASKPIKKKPTAKKKAIAKKKPAPKPATPATEASNDKIDKDAELCGMFTTFVSDYENKLIGCQGPSCIVYEKSLSKYQKKKQAYCH